MSRQPLDEVDKGVLLETALTCPGSKNQTRTFDEEGFRRRAGCICFRSDAEAEVWRRRYVSAGVAFLFRYFCDTIHFSLFLSEC